MDQALHGQKGARESNDALGLFLRKTDIFLTAARVFSDYKLVGWRADQLKDEAAQTELWDAAHDRTAVLLVQSFTKLQALWLKLGQYLSSRADVMPAPFLRELSRCQDSLDPPPFKETCAIIEAELGKPLNSVFAEITEKPLAVASIASVHRAVLLDGRQVVVKVQHASVRAQLLLDLRCLETICDTVKWLDSDFDLSPLVREWAKEVPKELDFRLEAQNMARVAANLAPFFKTGDDALSIDVRLAEVVPELTSERLLVMTYVDGFKPTDAQAVDAHGANRELLMRNITRAYAQQIFGDGFYSGDPHPGNVLVDRANVDVPVLLDFGLTKTLTEEEAYHFAKLIVAADEGDIHGLLQSMEGVGLRLRTDVSFDVSLLRGYFFRDAAPAQEAQKENAERRQKWREEAEQRKRTLYVGDKISVTTRFLGWNSSHNGEVIAVVINGDSRQLRIRLTDGSEMTAPASDCKLQSRRSPIDAWPDSFIFFERVLNLLRGLTAQLGVRQSYLKVMTPFARLALQKRLSPHLQTQDGDVQGVDTLGIAPLLSAALASGDALGVQVSVRRNGTPLTELAAGAADPYERAPCTQETLFCAFSVTKAVASAAVHVLASRGIIQLEERVSYYWPAFGAAGKENIRVCDVLAHRAGLQDAGTHELATDPLIACDSEHMMALIAAAAPDPEALGRTNYHYLSYGWILDGLVRGATGGTSLRDFARHEFGVRLHRDLGTDEFGIGITPGSSAPLSTLVLLRKEELASTKPPPRAAAKSSDGEAGATAVDGRRPAASPSLLLNPTYFNRREIRKASLPSANGHFTARALTSFYDAIASSKSSLIPGGIAATLLALRGSDAAEAAVAAGGEAMMQGGSVPSWLASSCMTLTKTPSCSGTAGWVEAPRCAAAT